MPPSILRRQNPIGKTSQVQYPSKEPPRRSHSGSMFIGRIGIWLAAVAIAFLPVILGVATSPRHLAAVFGAYKLLPFYRDLIFSTITVLCISIIDGTEVLIRGRALIERTPRIMTLLLILLCVIVCILCAGWSTGQTPIQVEDINMLFYILIIALGVALVQRIILIVED